MVTDTDIQRTLSETHDSLRAIEASSGRINSILNEPRKKLTNAKPHAGVLSGQFITFAIVCLITVTGMLGVLFFSVSTQVNADIDRLTARVNKLETQVASLKAEHKLLTPPSHGSGR